MPRAVDSSTNSIAVRESWLWHRGSAELQTVVLWRDNSNMPPVRPSGGPAARPRLPSRGLRCRTATAMTAAAHPHDRLPCRPPRDGHSAQQPRRPAADLLDLAGSRTHRQPPVGCVNAFMQLAGTRETSRRAPELSNRTRGEGQGRVARGIAPPGSPRTERDSLPSLRSRHLDHQRSPDPGPVGEVAGMLPGDSLPGRPSFPLGTQPLVLLADPTHQVGVMRARRLDSAER